MHTHFGSATNLAATFLGVLIAGTFWRIGWMHAMAFGTKRRLTWLTKLGGAALSQF